MTLQNAIKKLSKYAEIKNDGNGKYWINYKGYVVSFHTNGSQDMDNDVVCEHTQRYDEKADSMTDYFPGSYWDNLTQAIKYVERSFESDLKQLTLSN